MTVSQWKQNRFYPYYPGLEVDVLDVVGIAVSGQTKLKNVRNTYKDDDKETLDSVDVDSGVSSL